MDSSGLQGSSTLNQNSSSQPVQGSNSLLQNSNATVLQASPSTLAVVGEKQIEPSAFPVTDVTVLAIILIAAIAGVLLFFKD